MHILRTQFCCQQFTPPFLLQWVPIMLNGFITFSSFKHSKWVPEPLVPMETFSHIWFFSSLGAYVIYGRSLAPVSLLSSPGLLCPFSTCHRFWNVLFFVTNKCIVLAQNSSRCIPVCAFPSLAVMQCNILTEAFPGVNFVKFGPIYYLIDITGAGEAIYPLFHFL